MIVKSELESPVILSTPVLLTVVVPLITNPPSRRKISRLYIYKRRLTLVDTIFQSIIFWQSLLYFPHPIGKITNASPIAEILNLQLNWEIALSVKEILFFN